MKSLVKISTFSMLLCCLALAATVNGLEELYIQHTPSYMKFTSDVAHKHLKASQIPDFISAAIGFTPAEKLHWEGMKASNPLKRPKTVVVLELAVGFEKLDFALSNLKYPLVMDVPPSWPFQVIGDRIYRRFPDQELTLMDISNDDTMYAVKSQYPNLLQSVSVDPFSLEKDLTEDNSVLKGKTLTSLNATYTPDLECLLDLQLFKEVTDALKAKAKLLQTEPVVDLFWLHSSALQGLISVYGLKSPQVAEAVSLIRERAKQTENSFSKIYGDNFLMLFMAVDYQSHNSRMRLARSLQASDTNTNEHNIAESYDEDYPAIFNIIFLTCLIIGLSVFAIALGMWFMDPGRDSIIYRMTSQRIKKDQ